ncbi:MAG: hypothetical protein PPP58_11665 [Natronomonas sp.]
MSGTVGSASLWVVSILAQIQPPPDVGVDPGTSLIGSAIGSFVTTLVVAAILIAVAPGYTEARMGTVLERPIGCFAYGIVCVLVLVVVTILLFVTIVGILLAIPLLLLIALVWAIGAAIGYLAIADKLIGHEDGWLKPLLLAGAMSGGLALTGIGGLVSLCIAATGFGAILRSALG